MEDAHHLSSNAVIAADEYVIRENPESTKVLTSLLCKVMQEDGSMGKPFATWMNSRFPIQDLITISIGLSQPA
jgi:hypothetical protein